MKYTITILSLLLSLSITAQTTITLEGDDATQYIEMLTTDGQPSHQEIIQKTIYTKLVGWVLTNQFDFIEKKTIKDMINHCHCDEFNLAIKTRNVDGWARKVPVFTYPKSCKSAELIK